MLLADLYLLHHIKCSRMVIYLNNNELFFSLAKKKKKWGKENLLVEPLTMSSKVIPTHNFIKCLIFRLFESLGCVLEFKIKFCRVNRGVRRLVQPPQQDSGELRERENEETVIREQPRLLHTLVISALFVAQGTSILQFCRTRSTDNFKQKKTITKKNTCSFKD